MSFSGFAVNEINNCQTRRAKVRQSPKHDWFYRWRPLTFVHCSSFLTFRVSFTAGSPRRYLDPTEVAQVVQLLQDD